VNEFDEAHAQGFDRGVFVVTELLKGYIQRDKMQPAELLEVIETLQVEIFKIKQETPLCKKLN
jgi:hypothetical protein